MLNLIKLEIKKFKLQRYIGAAIITQLLLLFFLIGLQVIFQIENEPVSEIIEASMVVIDRMSSVTFSIFASVMLANIVISEYSKNTISLIFMYPISRKKIFLVKLIIIASFTFINIVISNIVLSAGLIVLNSTFNSFPIALTVNGLILSIPSIVLSAILVSATALIPLYFGMKKKSTPTVIVSSIIVSSVMYSSTRDMSLSSILPIAIVVAVVGLLMGISTVNKIYNEDVM